jgi:hypothetical protein
MNNHIVVKSDAVETRNIPARGERKSMTFREQRAAIETGDDFPQPFSITLDDDQRPYAPGLYQLDLSSLEVNEYKGLKVGRCVRLFGPISAAPVSK